MGIRKQQKNNQNPFCEDAINDVRIRRQTKKASASGKHAQIIYNPNTETIIGETQFLLHIEKDEKRFTKLFNRNYRAFWDLPKPATRVYGYILHTLKADQDQFIFKMSEAMEYTEYKTEVSIYQGLDALVKREIIARSESNWLYFINPLIFFNGNRIKYIRKYIAKRDKELIELKQII